MNFVQRDVCCILLVQGVGGSMLARDVCCVLLVQGVGGSMLDVMFVEVC